MNNTYYLVVKIIGIILKIIIIIVIKIRIIIALWIMAGIADHQL